MREYGDGTPDCSHDSNRSSSSSIKGGEITVNDVIGGEEEADTHVIAPNWGIHKLFSNLSESSHEKVGGKCVFATD